MANHLPQVIDHELDTRRKSAIYFAVIALAAVIIAAAFLLVLR